MIGSHLPGLAGCRRCRRLVRHMAELSPRRGLSRDDYWSAAVPGFGDPQARICLVGLAPGAHGANRTGRPFTGDGAGDFMYPLLYRAGLSSRPDALHAEDGMALSDLYITNAVKCLPPENRPAPEEFAACRDFLVTEFENLPRLKVVLALGQGAFTSCLRLWKAQGQIGRVGDYPFSHGATHEIREGFWLVGSYHTSRYNVQTGRIDEKMFLALLERVREIVEREKTVEKGSSLD